MAKKLYSGLMWFIDKDKPFREQVEAGISRYLEKFGKAPTRCLVHQLTLLSQGAGVEGIELVSSRSVLPNHLFFTE